MTQLTPEQIARLQATLDLFDHRRANLGGCSNGNCVIQRPKGMHTNGCCNCHNDRHKMHRFAAYADNFAHSVRAILEAQDAKEQSNG